MDNKQTQVQDFEVPDKVRIDKGISLLKHKLTSNTDTSMVTSTSILKVLDIGFAINGFGDTLSKNNKCQVFAVDIHDRTCCGLGDGDGVGKIIFTKKDINEGLPYENKFFDIITAGEVIEHMYNDEFFLQECKRVLKDDGVMIITTPNLHYLLNRITNIFGQMPKFAYCSFHYNIYNLSELTKKLERNGFKVDSVKSSHVLFSSRINPIGKIFEWLADLFPTFGAHLIVRLSKK